MAERREPKAAPYGTRAPRWLAAAAGITLLVAGVAVAGLTGLARREAVGSPSTAGSQAASASATPAAPSEQVDVLDAADLAAAIAAQRAGGLAPRVVVTSLGVDPTRTPGPSPRECGAPIGRCRVVGVLDGFDDPAGTVMVRDSAEVITPPVTPGALVGPLALRLAGTAPVELLGKVELQGAAGRVDVATLRAATDTAPEGGVRAVDGWLVGVNTPSCGPAIPGGSPPKPFDCPPMRSLLTATSVEPVTGGNGSYSVRVPDDAVQVQWGAYGDFAPEPANDGVNDEPRRGLYLVRMVAYDGPGCARCRGWLMVGRLDAGAPAPVASATSGS